MFEKIKEYRELISILTVVFYVIGFITYISYYNYFGIDIIPYIIITEILINSIIGISIFCLIAIPIDYIIEILLSKVCKKKNTIYILLNFLSYSLFVFIFFFIGFHNENLLWMMLGEGISLMLVYSLFKLIMKNNKIFYFSITRKVILFLMMVISIYSINILSRTFAAYKINNEKTHNITIIDTDEKKYSTVDNALYYVGETSSVFFIYDKENKSTIIINKNEIRRVIITRI